MLCQHWTFVLSNEGLDDDRIVTSPSEDEMDVEMHQCAFYLGDVTQHTT